MKLKIDVTQEDINNGCQCNESNCPIARAGMRAVAEATGRKDLMVNVNYAFTIFERELAETNRDENGKWMWTLPLVHGQECIASMILPDKAKKFVQRFDNDIPVKPFSFVVEV